MHSDPRYALGAALCWALSALVISSGLAGLRRLGSARVPAVVVGVLCSLVTGTLVLAVVGRHEIMTGSLDVAIALGGLLTFPIGTGLYYLTAVAYQDRAELSSQYANVKPLMSIAIGALVFDELLSSVEVVVTGLIVLGVVLLVVGARKGRSSLLPVLLGLGLAVAWSAGESLVRLASEQHQTIQISFWALLSSLSIVVTILVIALLLRLIMPQRIPYRISDFALRKPHLAFAAHGVISFGIAYTLFFHSIGQLGLSRSIMITVFWPTIALALSYGLARMRGRTYEIPGIQATAFAIFTVASLAYVMAGL